jgi:PAS domain S-box-containing protein
MGEPDQSEPNADQERRDLLGLFEQAPGFLCFVRGRELVFERANAAYRKLVGRDNLLGKPLRQALPELEGQGYFELLDDVFAGGQPFVGHASRVLLERTPGAGLEEAFVDFIFQPVRDEQGAIVGILVQGHDVTEARRQQLEKDATKERYRALFEAIDDGFCIVQLLFDDDGRARDYRFLEANAAFEEHTGLSDVVGKTARELVPDLDQSWFRLYEEVARTGTAVRFENHAPAMKRWFEVYASRVGDPASDQVALVFKNISVRKHAESVLQESEARFRNMADHAPVMLWLTDAAGQCVYLNRRWYEYTGQNEITGLGLGWLEAVHPEDAARSQQVFLSANATAQPFTIEYRLRRADGQYGWAIDAAAPRFNEQGDFLGYIGSVVDISEHKRAEEQKETLLQLEQLGRARAEEANRIKDEFLGMISHELRTPLSAVLGWARMLRGGTLEPQKREQALEVIERNTRAQAQLVDDLLDINRILSGKLKLEVEAVDVAMMVADAIETVRIAADAKGIRIQATLDSTNVVMGDPTRLQQIVWNLLSNAVKFTPKRGRVLVTVRKQDSSVELEVADTGAGIDPSFLPHVFERFSQADAGSTRRSGGLGLGLSIAKHLVEAHGGFITASSPGLGQGATFLVRLPLPAASRREASVPPPGASSAPSLPCPPELQGLHVLVVDDEPDARALLVTILESCKARVTAVASARAALKRLRKEPPDVLISDIGMPDEDGYALIRQVRALEPDGRKLPAVALTAYARLEDRTRVLMAGFQTHIGKPVEPVELLAVVASLLNRHTPIPD